LNATPSEQQQRSILAAFDFDGTLTYHDSFVPFLRFAFGDLLFARRIVRLAPASVAYLCGRITRNDLKARLIHTFLKGVQVAWVSERAEAYCDATWEKLMRAEGLLSVADQLRQEATVTICSASPALVLAPFAKRLGVRLIGTELQSRDGVLTGEIAGINCRCEQKVLRLEAQYGPLEHYTLRAWGDTLGDEQMLAAAQEANWRAFHDVRRRKLPLSMQMRKSGE